jgi:glycerate kinase
MRVLVAPNTFRGSLTAYKVAEAIGRGWSIGAPGSVITLMPVADGGDLTGPILRESLGA